VGDRIIIAKYSGVRVKGVDGKDYLLTNDKDITAVRKD
jgi:co-chaperonin GroES (HSP10)